MIYDYNGFFIGRFNGYCFKDLIQYLCQVILKQWRLLLITFEVENKSFNIITWIVGILDMKNTKRKGKPQGLEIVHSQHHKSMVLLSSVWCPSNALCTSQALCHAYWTPVIIEKLSHHQIRSRFKILDIKLYNDQWNYTIYILYFFKSEVLLEKMTLTISEDV